MLYHHAWRVFNLLTADNRSSSMKQLTFLLFFSLLLSLSALSQTLLPAFPVANGSVSTIVRHGNTIYLGGAFTYIGPNLPNGADIDATTGAPNLAFDIPNGNVSTAVPDGSGGWYIGGSFTSIGGQTRNRIARINADGSLHAWNPNAGS